VCGGVGLGVGARATPPNPQSPIPNPQSPILIYILINKKNILIINFVFKIHLPINYRILYPQKYIVKIKLIKK